ncbi:MAG: dephospho-CoA kinase [Bacteroidota bacterium]
MLKIGLTGGIGSGKSTVARVFETLGIPVYYADDAAKKLMNTHEGLREKLVAAFGEETYTGGQLNKPFLSSRVFNNSEQLEKLNAIVHPIVIQDGIDWMERQTTPYAIKEAAIFFESGSAAGLDKIIGVYAPQSLRIHRVMQRDGISRADVLARMQKQMNEEIKMKLCDFVITNDEQQMVLPQVLELHKRFMLNAES